VRDRTVKGDQYSKKKTENTRETHRIQSTRTQADAKMMCLLARESGVQMWDGGCARPNGKMLQVNG
jgi:hypothetical protein